MKTILFSLVITSFLHHKMVFGGEEGTSSSSSADQWGDPEYVMVDIDLNDEEDELKRKQFENFFIDLEYSNNKYRTIQLFKTYVLDLMRAVFTRYEYAKENTSLLQKGVECARSIKNENFLPPLDLILTSMTMAFNQPVCLAVIRRLNSDNALLSNLLDTTIDDIRKIIDVVLSASTLNLRLNSINDDSVEKYVEENDEKIFDLTYANFFDNSNQARKCYELMVGIEHNAKFFQLYLDGFVIIRRKMNEDGIATAGSSDGSQSNKTLDQIIEQIGELELENPPQWGQSEKKMKSLSFFVSASLYFIFGML